MNDQNLIGTAEVARLMDRTPQTVARMVHAGTLTPVVQLPGRTGAFLFDRDYIAAKVTA